MTKKPKSPRRPPKFNPDRTQQLLERYRAELADLKSKFARYYYWPTWEQKKKAIERIPVLRQRIAALEQQLAQNPPGATLDGWF
jgi:hypothetical protein